MFKFFFMFIIVLSINTFSQNETNPVYLDSTNIEVFFEDFCHISVKDEFEKNKDYYARIQNLNEQNINSGMYLVFIKEIKYQANAFNYDAEFERFFMAQLAANLSVHNEYDNFLEPDNIIVDLFSKEILMTLMQKKLGLFGAYKDYLIASSVEYDEYTNLQGDELSSRIFIYIPVDEAKAFKKNNNSIGIKIKMKVNTYSDGKIIKTSKFFPDTIDKMTDHTSYIIKGDIEEIMFYNLNTNKIYTTYRHKREEN